jgi:predicted membrane-bound spermidine synthase
MSTGQSGGQNPEGSHSSNRHRAAAFSSCLVHAVFLLSGISALLYQLAWQRSLMLIYGSNIESAAMVVSAFLVGLGLGNVAGGVLSRWNWLSPVLLFALAELVVGIYGMLSLRLFGWAGRYTLTAGTVQTGLFVFTLVFVPTVVMGATLPLLAAHRIAQTGHVGHSVSWLYFANTVGAAGGAFLAAFALLGAFGLSGTVTIAAVLNLISAASVLLLWRGTKIVQ